MDTKLNEPANQKVRKRCYETLRTSVSFPDVYTWFIKYWGLSHTIILSQASVRHQIYHKSGNFGKSLTSQWIRIIKRWSKLRRKILDSTKKK